MSDNPLIRVSAVVLHNADGHVLTVRKRGTSRFMLPGGKPEAGETPAETAVRECLEETGIDVAPGDVVPLGTFRAAAANEAGHEVEGVVFTYPSPVVVHAPAGEIEELRWLDLNNPLPDDLAPLLSQYVLPAVASTTCPTPPTARVLAVASSGVHEFSKDLRARST